MFVVAKSTSPYSLTNYISVNSAGAQDPQSQSAWTSGFDNYYLGMVTNAFDMTTGANIPPVAGQWGPQTNAPTLKGRDEDSDVYWTFEGSDITGINSQWGSTGVPTALPVTYNGEQSKSTISNLINWTIDNRWSGIDFAEFAFKEGLTSGFDYKKVAEVTKGIGSNGKKSSYTLLVGADFANKAPNSGYTKFKNSWNDAGGNFDKLILILNGDEIWQDRSDWKYVGSAVKAAHEAGVPFEKINLGVVSSELISENLNFLIDAIKGLSTQSEWPTELAGQKLGGLAVIQSNATEPVDPGLMSQITAGLGAYEEYSELSISSEVGELPSNRSDILAVDFQKRNSTPISPNQDVSLGESIELYGDHGGDLFVLKNPWRSAHKLSKDDLVITDFNLSEGDRIQLAGKPSDYVLVTDDQYYTHTTTTQIKSIKDGIVVGRVNSDDDSKNQLDLNNYDQFVYVDEKPTILPELFLSHNGIPFKSMPGSGFSEEQFAEYCENLIKYVTNNRIKTVFFLIGDYSVKKYPEGPYDFNFCDPNAPGANGTPWIVKHFMTQVPKDVDIGFLGEFNPKYSWKLYDKNNEPDPVNAQIGDGTNGHPMDNLHQGFKLAQALNQESAELGGAEFTHMQFDHEGGGNYQNPTPYGSINGQPIGVGYMKSLWNKYMPEAVTFKGTGTNDPANSGFTGHYQMGWINYNTEAWTDNSSGSMNAFSENYWFGELKQAPGDYKNPPEFNNDKDIPGKWLGLETLSEANTGKDPRETLPIEGGSNTYNWEVLTADSPIPSGSVSGEYELSKHASDTVYSYYKDYPDALLEIFDNPNYETKGGAKLIRLSDQHYGPLSSLDPSDKTGPQAAIATFSIENLSSTNGDNAQKPTSLIGQYTINTDANKNGGTFDGMSALSHDNMVHFLNSAAQKIAKTNNTEPEKIRLQIYEQQFLPMSWINASVANPWTDERLVVDGGNEVVDAGTGHDSINLVNSLAGNVVFGGVGADDFTLRIEEVSSNNAEIGFFLDDLTQWTKTPAGSTIMGEGSFKKFQKPINADNRNFGFSASLTGQGKSLWTRVKNFVNDDKLQGKIKAEAILDGAFGYGAGVLTGRGTSEKWFYAQNFQIESGDNKDTPANEIYAGVAAVLWAFKQLYPEIKSIPVFDSYYLKSLGVYDALKINNTLLKPLDLKVIPEDSPTKCKQWNYISTLHYNKLIDGFIGDSYTPGQEGTIPKDSRPFYSKGESLPYALQSSYVNLPKEKSLPIKTNYQGTLPLRGGIWFPAEVPAQFDPSNFLTPVQAPLSDQFKNLRGVSGDLLAGGQPFKIDQNTTLALADTETDKFKLYTDASSILGDDVDQTQILDFEVGIDLLSIEGSSIDTTDWSAAKATAESFGLLINAAPVAAEEISFVLYPGFSVTYIPNLGTDPDGDNLTPIIINGPDWISTSGSAITFETPSNFDNESLKELEKSLKLGASDGKSVTTVVTEINLPPDTEKPILPLRIEQIKPGQPAVGYDQVYNKAGQFNGVTWPLLTTDKEKELAGKIPEGSTVFSNDQKMFEDISGASGRGIQNVNRDGNPKDPASFTVTDDDGNPINIAGDGIDYIKTVIKAPNNSYYLTDGHHTSNTFALMERGGINSQMYFVLDKDLSSTNDANQNGSAMDEFWVEMANQKDAWLKILNPNKPGYSFLPGVQGNTKTGIVTSIDLDKFNLAMPNQFGVKNFSNDPYRAAFNFIRGISWDKPNDAPNFLEFFWAEELQDSIADNPQLDLHTNSSPYDLSDLEDYRNAMASIASWQSSLDEDELIGSSGRTAKEMGSKTIASETELNELVDYLVVSKDKMLKPESSDSAKQGTQSIPKPGSIGYTWAYKNNTQDKKLGRERIRNQEGKEIKVTYTKGSLRAVTKDPNVVISTNGFNQLNQEGVSLHDESASWTLQDVAVAGKAAVSYGFNFKQNVGSKFTSIKINNDGSVGHLNYDPITGTGARFNTIDGQLRMVMHAKDGGRGDLDGIANGTIVEQSAPGTIAIDNGLSVNNNILIIGDEKTANNAASAQFLKVNLQSMADNIYDVIVVPFAPGEQITLDNNTIRDRAYSLLCSYQSKDTPSLEGMEFSRTVQVLNNQQLAFFALKDRSLSELGNTPLTDDDFERLTLSADGSSASSSSGMSIKLEEGSVADMNVLIGAEGDRAPLIDFTSLAGETLDGLARVAREADYSTSLGFHKVENSSGAVLDSNGDLINPGDDGYSEAALRTDNLLFGGEMFQALDNQNKTEALEDFVASGLWAPYGQVHSTGQTYFSFKEANLDGVDHFRIMGNTTIGFEDFHGGGDRDFDDQILQLDFRLV